MKKEKKRIVHGTVETKSINGVDLVAECGVEEDYKGKDRHFWQVKAGDRFIARADDAIGKMHSLWTADCTTFEAFVGEIEKSYVFSRLDYSRGTYMIRGLYYETTEDEFEATITDVKSALDAGLNVHYNDDHGVGHFIKIGDGKYEAHHWRYQMERVEELGIEGISNFLREFHEVGCDGGDDD